MSSAAPERHRFTVEDYYRMADAGLLGHDERVELIEGEVIDMAAIGSRHAACVNRLNELFMTRLAGRAVVGVQNPVRLTDLSEPQPDVAVLRQRPDFYAGAHPGPADILLVVEVADTTLAWDRNVKVPLYGRAGIPEVWVVDLDGEVLDVFTSPREQEYDDVRQARRGESLQIAGITVDIDEMLG